MITEGFVDVEKTYGGFTIRDIKSKELTVYDGMGNNCCALSNVENKPIRLAFDRTGSIWLMTVKYTNGFMNSNYTSNAVKVERLTAFPFFPVSFTAVPVGTLTARSSGTARMNTAGRSGNAMPSTRRNSTAALHI